MSDHEHGHFNAEKIFAWLFLLTALEVGWGYLFRDFGRLVLWGGLLFFAFFKAWLIAVYFMHLKFEGWVVKSLLLPTPLLVLVIYGYVSPDISHNDHLDHPIGSMYDVSRGAVVEDMSQVGGQHGPAEAGAHEGDEPVPPER